MDMLTYLFELPVVDRLGWTLLHFLWQASLITLLCALSLKSSLGRKPRRAYRVSALALALCALCPIVTFCWVDAPVAEASVVDLDTPVVATAQTSVAVSQSMAPVASEPVFVPEALPAQIVDEPVTLERSMEKFRVQIAPYLPWLVMTWLVGASLFSVQLLCSWLEVRGFARRGTALNTSAWTQQLQGLCQTMGVVKLVRLVESAELISPIVVGALRPVILVPIGFLAQLEPAMVEAILLHELAHIRRHDYLVNLLQALLRALFFYHPAVWWLDRKASQLREFCCDEMAAQAIQDPDLYARALQGLAIKQREGFGLAPAANDGSLVSRIRVILGVGAPSVPSCRHLVGGSLFLLLALGLTTTLHFSSALELNEAPTPLRAQDGITGRVVDPEGKPVPHAEVALYRLKYFLGLDNGVVETATTDARGRFNLTTQLEFFRDSPEFYRDAYTVVAWNEHDAVAWHTFNSRRMGSGEVILQLSEPVSRTVRVIDTEGHPVADAEVFVFGLSESRSDAAMLSEGFGPLGTQTDVEGYAHFDQLPAVDLDIGAVKSGYAFSFVNVAKPKPVNELRLYRAGVVEGRVIDSNGAPLADLLVCAALVEDDGLHHYARTDAAGHFRLDGLYGEGAYGCGEDGGDGKYSVSIEDSRYQAAAFDVQVQPGAVSANHVLTATSAAQISVTVRDPATEAVIPFAQVSVKTAGADYELESDADGCLSFSAPRGKVSVKVSNPPLGYYMIYGYMGDSGRPSSIERVVGIEDQDWTLYAPSEVAQFVTLSGRVLWVDGSPAAGVILAATILDKRHLIVETQGRDSDHLAAITSDADGYFTFKKYPKGIAFTCMLRSDTRNEAAMIELPAVGVESTDIGGVRLVQTIQRPLEIVDLDGNPVANATIDYGPVTAPDLTRAGIVVRSTWRDRLYQQTTNSKGLVELGKCLPNQTYDLWIGNEKSSWKRILPEAMAASGRLRVVLDTRLLLSIKDSDGQPFTITEVARYGFARQDLDDDWNTIPILEHLESGDLLISKKAYLSYGPGSVIDLWVRTDAGAEIHAKGTFPERGSRLELIAEKVIPLRARVKVPAPMTVGSNDLAFQLTDSSGVPIAGVKVVSDPLNPHRRRERLEGETNAEGWCVFRDVPENITYCEFTKEGYATQWLADVAKGIGAPVILSNTTRMSGQIRGSDGNAPGVVQLLFEARRPKQQWDDGSHITVDHIPQVFETDGEGRYDFLIESGEYRVSVTSESGGQLKIEDFSIPAGQHTALPDRLQPYFITELRLVDSVTGEPVEGIYVSVSEVLSPFRRGYREGALRVSDADGIVRWEDLLPGSVRFDSQGLRNFYDLPPREYCRWWSLQEPHEYYREQAEQYMKRPPRGRDGERDLTYELSSEQHRFEVIVERGIYVSGVVELPEEKLRGAISVRLISQDSHGMTDFVRVDPEDGSFGEWMPAGNGSIYRVHTVFDSHHPITPKAFWPVAVSEPFESKPGDRFEFKLSMRGGGWLQGRVTDAAGQPVTGVEIKAIPTDQLIGADAETTIQTDAAGHYSMGPIRATEYEVRIAPSSSVKADVAANAKRYATVKAGERAEVGDLVLE